MLLSIDYLNICNNIIQVYHAGEYTMLFNVFFFLINRNAMVEILEFANICLFQLDIDKGVTVSSIGCAVSPTLGNQKISQLVN